jgi:hypothetical protein
MRAWSGTNFLQPGQYLRRITARHCGQNLSSGEILPWHCSQLKSGPGKRSGSRVVDGCFSILILRRKTDHPSEKVSPGVGEAQGEKARIDHRKNHEDTNAQRVTKGDFSRRREDFSQWRKSFRMQVAGCKRAFVSCILDPDL